MLMGGTSGYRPKNLAGYNKRQSVAWSLPQNQKYARILATSFLVGVTFAS